MRTGTAFILGGLLLALAPSPAQAQLIVTPYAGAAFGLDTVEPPRTTFGGSVTFMFGIIGIEGDVAVYPDFFPEQHPYSHLHVVGDLTTLMANVVLGAPLEFADGGPYVSGGIGYMNIRADEPHGLFDVRGNDPALNFGGGVTGFFTERLGLRADLRYFRNLRDEEPEAVDFGHSRGAVGFKRFQFLRGTVGLALRF